MIGGNQMALAMLTILFSDTATVDIRALVSQDIDRAAYHSSATATHSFVERVFSAPEYVLVLELALVLIMAGLFIRLVVRFRKMAREQKRKLAAEQRMSVKRPPSISRTEVEKILNQIANEKVKAAEMAAGGYYIDYSGRLDSNAAVQEMARTHRMESERLNYAISFTSQAAKQTGTKFKEAFALVSEDSDLNVLARQLNMGRGELELILALKKTKIANSRELSGNTGRRRR